MHDATKGVLADLIKYLRKMEITEKEEGEPEDMPPTGMVDKLKDFAMEERQEEEAGMEPMFGEDVGEDYGAVDLDEEVEEEEDEPMTEAQQKMADFMNNRRPKRAGDRKSKTFFMEAKVNGKPVAKVTKKG